VNYFLTRIIFLKENNSRGSLRSPKLAPWALSKKIIHVAPPNREPARRLKAAGHNGKGLISLMANILANKISLLVQVLFY